MIPGLHYHTFGANEDGLNQIDESDDHGPYCDVLFSGDTYKMIREITTPAGHTARLRVYLAPLKNCRGPEGRGPAYAR